MSKSEAMPEAMSETTSKPADPENSFNADYNARIETIQRMEKILDGYSAILRQLNAALDKYDQYQCEYHELLEYYSDGRYLQDFETDNQGKFPQNLKRRVLSEDAVFDLISEEYNLAIRLLETGTRSIKR